MRFEHSIVIPAPREKVWSIAQDPALRPSWDVRVAEYRPSGPLRNGTKIAVVLRWLFLRAASRAVLVQYDPPRQSAIRIESPRPWLFPSGGGMWLFEDVAEGTRMTTRFQLAVEKMTRVRVLITRWFVCRDTIRSLERLRRLVVMSTQSQRALAAEGAESVASKERPDYGIDAPGVVRNLGIAGVASLFVATASLLDLIPRVVGWHGSSGGGVRLAVVPSTLSAGVALCAAACWMYFGSRYGKTAERDKLIGRIEWKGDERVLDVGCGRGLILVGAALKLKTGSAVGVDIWQSRDLSGNRADVPLKNAALEGVGDRVTVQTADMRRMPFEPNSFDVVLSRAAIHNLYSRTDRAAAIREIARVLHPGGRAVIADIRHHAEYMKTFMDAGCRDMRLLDSKLISLLCALFTMGSMRPNTLLVRKVSARNEAD